MNTTLSSDCSLETDRRNTSHGRTNRSGKQPSVIRQSLKPTWTWPIGTVEKDGLESGSEVRESTYLPDECCIAQPLADMFNAVNLPHKLEGQQYVPILHPELQDHLLLKKRAWKPRSFTLEDFLDKAQLETASPRNVNCFGLGYAITTRLSKDRCLYGCPHCLCGRVPTIPTFL